MNMSEENDATMPGKKSILVLFNPSKWSIKWKAQLNFLLRAVVAIGLLILLVNIILRYTTIKDASNKLALLSDTKSKYIEDYFAHINQQIKAFSVDRQTHEAFNQLTGSFINIESDNYFTPSVGDLDRLNTTLEGFYKTEIIPSFEDESVIHIKALLPADNKQRILQFLYLASNPKPFGLKGSYTKADDGSAYSYMHSLYHPELAKYARQAGLSDILFVDYATGYVTYSLKKNLDFATNLFDGPYKNSSLGMAFKSAIANHEPGKVYYTDATVYIPAFYSPQVFISTPIFSGTQLLGAVIFAINKNTIDNILIYDSNTEESLKSIIVGADLYYRNDDPAFLHDMDTYLKKLRRNAADGNTYRKASLYKTTAMVQQVDALAFAEALKGKEGITHYTTETGDKVICSYTPLDIANLQWILLTQIDKSDALSSLRRFMLILAGIALFIAFLLHYISGFVNNSITSRLGKLKEGIMALSDGEHINLSPMVSGDEIGFIGKELTSLSDRIIESAGFVTELSKGNLQPEFPISGEKDRFGIAMNDLKKSLVARKEEEEKRKVEDEIRNWTTHGIAMFNDILRTDNNNLEKLTGNIIKNIVQYLSANQGGIFLVEDEGEENRYLDLIASYAFDRQKFIKKRIGVGEGLAGTCVIEKKTILTNRIPDNYISITSGLGGATPKCLLIVPLKKDEEILGVLEIASFEYFKPHEVEFVEKIAESIAAALITVKLHLQTKEYLERFQQQAEEMKAQDEELRQNIEELQATHEQMERLKLEEDERNKRMIKEMEDYRKLLISVLNEVPEKIFLKDDKGRFIIANKLVAENYNKTVEEILGKSDFDFYPKDKAAEYFKLEQDIIKSGKTQSFEEGDPSKEDGLIVRSIKKQFYIEHLGVTGLFGVQFDISDIKRKEYEALKLAEEIRDKQQEVEVASVELKKEKALMDALLENVPELIYFKNKESKFIRFSRSMMKLFNVDKPEDLIGKSDFDFFADEHARPAYDDEQRIIKTRKAIFDLEEKEVMEDGRARWVNTTKMPLMDVNGEVIGTFGITKDITHMKNLQQEAMSHTEELKAQEEELRQNLEEMMATQEDLKRQLDDNEKMKDALGKEKALMDALMNTVPESIYFKDKNSKFIRFSKSLLKLFGLQRDEDLLGKSDFDFFAEEHARPAYENEQKIIKTGKAMIDIEEKEVMEDGKVNWVNTTKMPLLDTEGNIIGTFGITKNISHIKKLQEEAIERNEELKAQEEELRQNLEEMQTTQEDLMAQITVNKKIQEELVKEKALMDALMDNVPESIYFKDKESRFIRFSKSMLKLFGLKKEGELIGKSDFDFFAEEHARPAYEDEQKIIKTGKAMIDIEEKEVMDDGRVNWVNTTKMPLKSKAGDIMGTFGISKNITRIKKLEIESNEKAEKLRETERKLAALQKEIEQLKKAKR
jgi:PAS domain S-box-containing protein